MADLPVGNLTFDWSPPPERSPEDCLSTAFFESEPSLASYRRFGFLVNGVATAILSLMGVVGIVALLLQVKRRMRFQDRLGDYLQVLCVWDMLLLVSSLASYSVLTIIYRAVPFNGIAAYLLMVMNPLGNFTVVGTIWQIVAITVERYIAVCRPFQAVSLSQKIGVRYVCAAIGALSLLLNLPPALLERTLQSCYSGDSLSVQINPTPLYSHHGYQIAAHFLPDLLFRCPLPFAIVVGLTVLIVKELRNSRPELHPRQCRMADAKRKCTIELTILNIKFVLCNIVFMCNTLWVMATSMNLFSDKTRLSFMLTLYLTDIGNLLLVVNSSTNWLLFYRWAPTPSQRRRQGLSSSTRADLVTPRQADALTRMWLNAEPATIGVDLLVELLAAKPWLAPRHWLPHDGAVDASDLRAAAAIRDHGAVISRELDETVARFCTAKRSARARVFTRLAEIGSAHQASGVRVRNSEWQTAKRFLVERLMRGHSPRNVDGAPPSETQRIVATAFVSLVIQGMKAGALCEAVRSNCTPTPSLALSFGTTPPPPPPVAAAVRTNSAPPPPRAARVARRGPSSTVSFEIPASCLNSTADDATSTL